MKKVLVFLAMMLTGFAARAGELATTNYFVGYVYVPDTYADAGDTGLTVSNAYLCFPLTAITGLTSNQASTTTDSDVRAVVDKFLYSFYVAVAAETNAPSKMSIHWSQSFRYGTTTDVYEVSHSIFDVEKALGTSTYISE